MIYCIIQVTKYVAEFNVKKECEFYYYKGQGRSVSGSHSVIVTHYVI